MAEIGDKDGETGVAENVGGVDKANSNIVVAEPIVTKNVDKGKGIMVEDDSLVRKKIKTLSKGIVTVIR